MQSELELARAAMIAKRFGGNASGASTGGEGTVRRKKKGAHKSLGGLYKLVTRLSLDIANYFSLLNHSVDLSPACE